jgi:hypothetical protein
MGGSLMPLAEPTFSIDFLPADYRERLRARREIRPRVLLLGVALVAMLGTYLWLGQELSRLRRTRDFLREATAHQRELQEKVENRQRELQQLGEQAVQWLTHANRRPTSQILQALMAVRTPGLWWEEIHIRKEKASSAGSPTRPQSTPLQSQKPTSAGAGGLAPTEAKTVVTLVGWATTSEDLSQYLASISRSRLFRRLELIGGQLDNSRSSPLRFEIRLEVPNPEEVLAGESSQGFTTTSGVGKG